LVPFLVATWAYSNAPFVLALPFERTEAILEGMVAAFEFFGCVPREVWWDNPKTVATLILQGRERQLHPRYAALASHYLFDPRFCLPRRGNEKPDAESTVKAVQRRFATPVPCVANLEELNTFLHDRCLAERARTVQSLCGPFEIATRFAEEHDAALPLPAHRFDPCVIHHTVEVDKYQTVAFDTNRYSVPRPFAFQMVTVKGYAGCVVIAAAGQVIARHVRSQARHTMVLDPLHYLATLGHKPGTLDSAPVFRDWQLPACFADFRARLEEHRGALPGSRQFVRVLQLLGEHPLSRVRQAIEACSHEHLFSAEAVVQRTGSLAAREAARGGGVPLADAATKATPVQVPLPDLSRFDMLLSTSDISDEACHDPIPISTPEHTEEAPVPACFA
jgi:hypothetical protein